MDRGAWQGDSPWIPKSQAWLNNDNWGPGLVALLIIVIQKFVHLWAWKNVGTLLYILSYLSNVTKSSPAIPCMCLVTQLCPALCNPIDYSLPGSFVQGDSPGKNTGVGWHALLQGIFPSQGLNPGLPHCRPIPSHLSHQGSPYMNTIYEVNLPKEANLGVDPTMVYFSIKFPR